MVLCFVGRILCAKLPLELTGKGHEGGEEEGEGEERGEYGTVVYCFHNKKGEISKMGMYKNASE